MKRQHSAEGRAASNVAYALQEQEYAMKSFPNAKTVGEALDLFHKSELGKRIQRAALADHYTKMQTDTALGNAHEVAKSRASTARYFQSKPGDNGDGMDNIDWSDDKQATAAYRAEKARKEGDQGSHEDKNTRARRKQTGEHINPGPVSP
jgi:hypothetical protein